MITITIQTDSAGQARREMLALLGDQLVQIERAPTAEEVATRKEIVRDYVAANGVEPFAPEAVEEAVAEPEQPRRARGRPRKNPVTIDGESTLVSETTTPAAAEPEQIDLEDVIAAKRSETENAEQAAQLAGIEAEAARQEAEGAGHEEAASLSQPADADKGWTHDDAKSVARAMYVRLNTLQQHELDERLHKNLQAFGVQRIKDLPAEKIEAFVRGIEGEVV